MQAIPLCETRCYAPGAAVGSAPRAVGRPAAKTPIPIVIPWPPRTREGRHRRYSGEAARDQNSACSRLRGAAAVMTPLL